MELSFDEIVSVAGKGGLFKILKPTKNGYIVEELADSKKKLVLGPNHRVSLLKEISIYTTDEEGAIPLRDVYSAIRDKFKAQLPVQAKDESDKLFAFLQEVVPDFDSERVYHSDVKKLVSWYNIILREKPDLAFEDEEGSEEEAKSDDGSESKKDKKPAKKAAATKPKTAKTSTASKPVSSAKKGASKPSSSRKMG